MRRRDLETTSGYYAFDEEGGGGGGGVTAPPREKNQLTRIQQPDVIHLHHSQLGPQGVERLPLLPYGVRLLDPRGDGLGGRRRRRHCVRRRLRRRGPPPPAAAFVRLRILSVDPRPHRPPELLERLPILEGAVPVDGPVLAHVQARIERRRRGSSGGRVLPPPPDDAQFVIRCG